MRQQRIKGWICCICTRRRTSIHCYLWYIWRFNHIHQVAHPSKTLFLESAWVSRLNGISVGSGVFEQPTPGRRALMVQSHLPADANVIPQLLFWRTQVCTANNLLFGSEGLTESVCVIVQYFVNSDRTVAEIWRFSDCLDGGRPPS